MATRRRKSTGTARGRRRSGSSNMVGIWLVGGAALIVVLVILLVRFNQTPAAIDTAQYEGLPENWINHNVLGDPNAPVTIQAWEDFL